MLRSHVNIGPMVVSSDTDFSFPLPFWGDIEDTITDEIMVE